MCALIITKKHIEVFVYIQPNLENDLIKRINLGIYHIQ
jgi:hypothetical protein